MAKAAVKNSICEVCGAEIRDGALFCYGCGFAVPERKDEARTTISAEPENSLPAIGAPAILPSIDDPQENAGSNGDRSLDRPDNTKLEPASALRRKKRVIERQPMEVVWEEPESASNRFILASVILTMVVLVLLVAAYYLR